MFTNAPYSRLILLILLLSGCSRFQLPAIDPSGQRIFLPGQSTTLATDGCFPQRAFVTPAVPPPCPTVGTGIIAPGTPVVAAPAQPILGPVTPGQPVAANTSSSLDRT